MELSALLCCFQRSHVVVSTWLKAQQQSGYVQGGVMHWKQWKQNKEQMRRRLNVNTHMHRSSEVSSCSLGECKIHNDHAHKTQRSVAFWVDNSYCLLLTNTDHIATPITPYHHGCKFGIGNIKFNSIIGHLISPLEEICSSSHYMWSLIHTRGLKTQSPCGDPLYCRSLPSFSWPAINPQALRLSWPLILPSFILLSLSARHCPLFLLSLSIIDRLRSTDLEEVIQSGADTVVGA